jgi:hypothetical protein
MTIGPAQVNSSTRAACASAARAEADERRAEGTAARYSWARFGRSLELGVMTRISATARGHAGSASALEVMTATTTRAGAGEFAHPLCEPERGLRKRQPALPIGRLARTGVKEASGSRLSGLTEQVTEARAMRNGLRHAINDSRQQGPCLRSWRLPGVNELVPRCPVRALACLAWTGPRTRRAPLGSRQS